MCKLEEPGSTRDALITGTVPAPVMSSPSLIRRAKRPMISVVTRSSIQHWRCRTFIAPHQIEVASTHIEQFMQFDVQRCMIVPAL
jgi:hypothetical protein